MALLPGLSETTVAPLAMNSTPLLLLPVPSAFTSAASEMVPIPVSSRAWGATVKAPAAVRSTLPLPRWRARYRGRSR